MSGDMKVYGFLAVLFFLAALLIFNIVGFIDYMMSPYVRIFDHKQLIYKGRCYEAKSLGTASKIRLSHTWHIPLPVCSVRTYKVIASNDITID